MARRDHRAQRGIVMTRTQKAQSDSLRRLLLVVSCALSPVSAATVDSIPTPPSDWRVQPLAQTGVVVHRSPDPENIYLGTPSILALPSRRLIAACDHFGPGVDRLGGPIGIRPRFDAQDDPPRPAGGRHRVPGV